MTKQNQNIFKNLALLCIVGVLASAALTQIAGISKIQKLGKIGLATSLMAGVGLSMALPRDDENDNFNAKMLSHKKQQSLDR